MIVVFDTNIWISDLALTSGVGSAVRYYLYQQSARIGLPEVVKLETEVHLRTTLTNHIKKIRDSHRQLLSVFGRLKEVVLPADDQVEELISQVFSNLGVEIEEFPFSLASAQASLIRTVQKISPCDKSQEFKDGVLWEDCLSILKDESVYLVTNDKAFYKKREFKQGLADDLQKDVKGLSNEFKIFPSLGELLSQLGGEANIDHAYLLESYLSHHRESLENMASKHSFVLDGKPIVESIEVFATEKPDSLYVTFTIELPCSDTTHEERSGAKIVARGEASYDSQKREFTDFASRGDELLYQLEDGTEKTVSKTVVAVANMVIGHREVEHSVRYKL